MPLRTPVSGMRNDELRPCFAGDFRVKIVYVLCPGSVFEKAAETWLRENLKDYITEAEALALIAAGRGPRLVVSTSENIDFSLYHPAPVVVLGHGLGLHKMVFAPDSGQMRQSGVVDGRHLAKGHVTVVVTHPDIKAQFLRACPEAAGHIVIGGDPSHDRITASLCHRAEFRVKFGVEDHELLVGLTTSWNEGSLLHEWVDVVTTFLARLPSSRYRVALMLHPHLWAVLSKKGIEDTLEPHIRSGGLILVPPDEWHSLVAAADAFVGDPSSPLLYAAMAGVPTAFGTYLEKSVAKGTLMEEAKGLFHHIDRDRDLRSEINDLIAQHDASLGERLRGRLIAQPGRALEGLRELFYEKMGIDLPGLQLPMNAADLPTVPIIPVRASRDFPKIDGQVIRIDRYPDAICEPGATRDNVAGHLVVECDERNLLALENAAVLVASVPTEGEAQVRRLIRLLDSWPGARMVVGANSDGCDILFRRRDAPSERFSVKVLAKKHFPVSAVASAVYALWMSAKACIVGNFIVWLGDLHTPISIMRAAF
jgi:hypothetical protein